MDVLKAIQTRRSVRAYKSESVPEESLKKVLEAARLAPSANNAQAYKLIVVRDENRRKELAEATGQLFISQAPVIIAAASLSPEGIMRSGVPTYAVDLAIVIDHMTLMAAAEGLGTCWIGAFPQEGVKEVLGIPKEYKIVALMPLGFPADTAKEKVRKKIEEIVCHDKFSI